MYNKSLAVDILRRIEESLNEMTVWTKSIQTADDFASTPEGMILLNAVCMKLLAVGEEVKALDRRTDGKLLSKYREIPWKEVTGLRDIIAHHYFDVDAGEIFTVLRIDIPPLLNVIRQMIEEVDR
jgi:uncharacterized protein with HEPN domain